MEKKKKKKNTEEGKRKGNKEKKSIDDNSSSIINEKFEVLNFLENFSLPIEINLGGNKTIFFPSKEKQKEGKKINQQGEFVKFKLEGENGSITLYIPYENFLNTFKNYFEGIILEEKFKGMVDMAYFISHEIRNPFFALKNVITSIESKFENIDKENIEEIRNELKVSKVILDRIDSILTNISVWLKGDRFSEKLFSLLNIESVLEDSISELYDMGKFLFKYEFLVKKEYLSDRIFIRGDRFLLKRAFLNLLLNAVESLENSKKKEVYVKTYDEGDDFIVCEIRDTGCGIPEENLQKVFLPFFTTKARGMGLGMSAVKKIVEIHNGKIEITSEVGRGTKVKILFPSKT